MLRREMARRRKDLPGLTTLHACCKVPMSDSSSLRVHTLRESHLDTTCRRRCNLSSGRRSWPSNVSIMIPRKLITGLGPSLFSGANSTPRYVHSFSRVSKCSWQIDDSGGPATTKSSR